MTQVEVRNVSDLEEKGRSLHPPFFYRGSSRFADSTDPKRKSRNAVQCREARNQVMFRHLLIAPQRERGHRPRRAGKVRVHPDAIVTESYRRLAKAKTSGMQPESSPAALNQSRARHEATHFKDEFVSTESAAFNRAGNAPTLPRCWTNTAPSILHPESAGPRHAAYHRTELNRSTRPRLLRPRSDRIRPGKHDLVIGRDDEIRRVSRC